MTPQAAVRLLLDLWRDRGWAEDPVVAAAMVHTAMRDGLTEDVLIEAVTPSMASLSGASRRKITSVSHRALSGVFLERAGTVLRSIEELDSFDRCSEILIQDIRPILPQVANLREEAVKRFLVDLLGEPTVPKDWGGEADDVFSTHVRMDGREVAATFALKGRGVRGRMKIRHLGKNADQIVRLTRQPASLFVVQHVDEVDSAVRQALESAVIAVRATRNSEARGSVWDGIDTGRLLVAYGYINISDGSLTLTARRLLEDKL